MEPKNITFSTEKSFEEAIKIVKNFLEQKKIGIFAEIDHSKNAREVSFNIENNYLIIFGNPLVGTYILMENGEAGIDLPLKILLWSKNGKTIITHPDPGALKIKYNLNDQNHALEKIETLYRGIRDALS